MSRRAVLYQYVVTRRAELLRRFLTTEWELVELEDASDVDAARRAIAGAEVFVGNSFATSLAEAAGGLRLVQCIGAGVDLFDRDALPAGCALCNVYEHEIPVAEYVMLNVLRFAAGIGAYEAGFRQGAWSGSGRHAGAFHGELFGRTLGLIGFGHIGQEVARRAKAFGLRVLAVRRSPEPHPDLDWCGPMDELERLLGEADFVVVACPLTDATRGLLGERELGRMKPAAFLVNPARGEIIDERALFEALRDRRIAGAALDVWYQYPPDTQTRMHGSARPFHELDNVVVTPHLSAWTEPMLERRYQRIAENLDHVARGEPLQRVVYRAPGR